MLKLYRKLRKLSGWLALADFEIMRTVVGSQSEQTAIAEIGVHHGKSFIALALSSGNRQLYAIDIFGNQVENVDKSGSGDKQVFLENLARFGIDENRVVIDERLSSSVGADEIYNSVGKVGFFHIDGGHNLEAVSGDIELACAVDCDESVLVFDDLFRADWPEVSHAVFSSHTIRSSNYQLFAIGFNKGYFCKPPMVAHYQSALRANSVLKNLLTKNYQVHEREVPIYSDYPLPEWSLARLIVWFGFLRMPLVFVRFFPSYSTLKKIGKRLGMGA